MPLWPRFAEPRVSVRQRHHSEVLGRASRIICLTNIDRRGQGHSQSREKKQAGKRENMIAAVMLRNVDHGYLAPCLRPQRLSNRNNQIRRTARPTALTDTVFDVAVLLLSCLRVLVGGSRSSRDLSPEFEVLAETSRYAAPSDAQASRLMISTC